MVIEKKFDAAENCWRIQLFGDIDIYNAPELKKVIPWEIFPHFLFRALFYDTDFKNV